MDGIRATLTSLIVIALVFILILVVFHIFKPRVVAWIRSNGEEKISLSKNKLYHANGYMIQSNSDIVLGSTGSFKRFDSIDRDYKHFDQSSLSSAPTWNIPASDNIPPQPLRPAPAPSSNKMNKSKNPDEFLKTIKQQSLDRIPALVNSSAIPRPQAKRQLSTPTTSTSTPVNLSANLFNIIKIPRLSTNPFLNGSLECETLRHTPSPSSIPENEQPDRDKSSTLVDLISTKTEQILRQSSSSSCNLNNPFIVQNNAKTKDQDENARYSPTHKGERECDDRNCILEEYGDSTEPNLYRKQSRKSDGEIFINIGNSFTNPTSPHIIPSSIATAVTLQHSQSQNVAEQAEDDVFVENETFHQPQYQTTNKFFNILSKLNDDPLTSRASSSMASYNTGQYIPQSRTRSLSETEFLDSHRLGADFGMNNGTSANPFVNAKLHKTLSENFLEQYNMLKCGMKNGGKTQLSRDGSIKSLGSNCSMESVDEHVLAQQQVQRAMSCESVTSQSSILVSDLVAPAPTITGYLCIGLQYDKNSITETGQDLVVTVLEAKELIGPTDEEMNTFVRIYIVPDETGAMQTKLFKGSTCPSYNESFCFWINRKPIRRSLWFHLYHTNNHGHVLIGEAEMKLHEITRPVTTWLALSDSKHTKKNNGEIMFSLSYLPTAERLTIVVVKARNLKVNLGTEPKNIFVKIYLLKNNKKVSKKKTSIKRNEKSPIYNESMIFSVPPYMLDSIQIRLTVLTAADVNGASNDKHLTGVSVGHVIVGSDTTGKGLRHWHQMLNSLRKPVAMWHPLRITCKKIS